MLPAYETTTVSISLAAWLRDYYSKSGGNTSKGKVTGNYPALRDLFKKDPPDILHFAGHGVVESGLHGALRYAIRLEDGKLDPWD